MTITQPNSWITTPKPNPNAKLRLFCLPYAGGSALIYRPWAVTLPHEIEVCPIELPGRGLRMREPTMDQLGELVGAIATALKPYFDKPFAFFGHSMGALLSFELAQLLQRQYPQSQLLHLLVSGCRAPHILRPNPLMHTLSDPELRETLRRLNGTPTEVLENEELMHLLLPTIRTDLRALETYRYSPNTPLTCPITTLGGIQDPEVSLDALEAWREHTVGLFSIRLFPGDHFFVHTQQAQLLQFISHELHAICNI